VTQMGTAVAEERTHGAAVTRRARRRRDELRAWGFTGPGAIWVFAFTVFPLFRTLVLAFQRTTLYGNQFAGFGNFVRLWKDYRFWTALRVTLIFVGASVSVTLVLGAILALALNRGLRGTRFFRALSILPMFAAPIALGYLGLTIFYEQGGPVNNLLVRLGLPPVRWLSDGRWAMVSILAVDVWQWTPFVFLVVLAALQSVSPELLDAGRLDTDSSWKLFTRVTLPLIRAPLGTVIILRIVEAFKVFDIPFTLTNGGPGIATRPLTYDVYTTALRNRDFGYAATMAVVMLVLVSIVAAIFYRVQRGAYE
jgi:multiple sugar transport system permease protein